MQAYKLHTGRKFSAYSLPLARLRYRAQTLNGAAEARRLFAFAKADGDARAASLWRESHAADCRDQAPTFHAWTGLPDGRAPLAFVVSVTNRRDDAGRTVLVRVTHPEHPDAEGAASVAAARHLGREAAPAFVEAWPSAFLPGHFLACLAFRGDG